ncbi:Transcriptional regulator, TetR family [Actinokineospora spheciospongiae]|uniref:Transcriptional regulator, TetR family n=1 Tax=Actinokineospora spheciospongiae TaxID=909613 RepID=W7IX28_9PSEU|nr:TetR family transcriptional regulator C-terminal domain-containing protein [Actinokineospora spheciospongiae]EWC61377.1 Transcriptional regulator, TetR family [Actinokineospora spheciospongiae]PWW62609.1 TetR family transcriptional regulator [Actinokineospora spheciospongiae]
MGHRELLLDAARRLLEDKGYAHITARDLVAASGTNLASIGYHFGSKNGLLNAALGDVFEEWTDALAEVALADPHASPLQRAHLTWATVLLHLADKRALLLSFVEALAQAERDPALREQLAEVQDRTRTRVAEIVATSYGDADVHADDPRCTAVAGFILAVCDGLALQWLLDPQRSPRPEHLLAGLNDLVARSQN